MFCITVFLLVLNVTFDIRLGSSLVMYIDPGVWHLRFRCSYANESQAVIEVVDFNVAGHLRHIGATPEILD